MTPFVDRASLTLVSVLITLAARSFILAGIAAAALKMLRVRTTSLRLFTWTSVLYASLALPLLGRLLPSLQVPVPQFLQDRIAPTTRGSVQEVPNVSLSTSHSETSSPEARLSARHHPTNVSKQPTQFVPESIVTKSSPRAPNTIAWNLVAAAIYLTITLILFARFAIGIVWSSRLVCNSEPITDAFANAMLASHAQLAKCERVSVPLTVGVFRQTILLPPDWRAWDPDKFHAVLAHELSHVARRDTLTQRVSLLYRAIFWFNPLAWWLHRHLAELAEQASDEAALSNGADQKQYARTLLGFFDSLQTSPRRIRWQGVSMARAGQAEQRLERILAWKGNIAMNVRRSFAAAILVLAVPVVYLAASVRPSKVASVSFHAAVLQQAPATTVAPAAPVARIAPAHVAAAPFVAPVPPAPVIAPVAPVAPMALMDHGKRVSYHYGFDDEERFVIASGKSDSMTMSGSSQDIRHVEKLKKQIPGDFIWFQRDEKSYIIRDQATIDRARGFWAGQEELGRKQEELGKQQEELGKQQEALGAKMEQVKVNVPDLTADLDRLKAKLQKLGPTATMEQLGELQSEIGELQSKMGDIQGRAGEEQGKIGALQGELGEKQGKLGEQQGELGRQQGELAEKANTQMQGLLDEAIKNGTAKPEDDVVKNPTL